jgi:hypothetical protein
MQSSALDRPWFDGRSVARNKGAYEKEALRHAERIEVPVRASRASGAVGARFRSTDLGRRS